MANNTGNTILALLTGTALGVGLGLLYAPQSGDKTRKQLRDEADHLQENLIKNIKKRLLICLILLQKPKKSIEEKLDKTFSNASTKADGMLSKLESELEQLKKKNSNLQKELKNK